MHQLIVILQKALPVFIMLGVGMLCRKRRIISREGIAAMKTFAVNITLPAVMLSAFAIVDLGHRRRPSHRRKRPV